MQFNVKLYAFIVSLILFAIPLSTARGDGLEFNFNSKSYFHNLEYIDIPYREGETFFGDHITLQTVYKPNDVISYTGGVFLGKTYGAEVSLEPVQPILTFHYQPGDNFSLTFGSLKKEGHTFLDAIFDDVLQYTRPQETGFEIFAAYKPVRGNLWINWQLLNTPEHREKFDFGSITEITVKPVALDIQLHIIHRGGQLYGSGPVSDNYTSAIGITYPLPFFDECRISGHYLFSRDVPDRSIPSLTQDGSGVEGEIFINILKWKIFYSLWSGDKFYTEDGDPFYQADSLMKLGFDRTFDITKKVNIILGATSYYIDDNFTHSAKLLVNFGADFKMFQHREDHSE